MIPRALSKRWGATSHTPASTLSLASRWRGGSRIGIVSLGHSRNANPYASMDDSDDNPVIYSDGLAQFQGSITYILTYEIPYLAGLSHSGDIYFRHKDIPDNFIYNGRSFCIDDYWVIHERTEHNHMHAFGQKLQSWQERKWLESFSADIFQPQEQEWVYQPAHQFALHAERGAVENDGIDWGWYCDYCRQFWPLCDTMPKSCPPCLDLRPYEDEVLDRDVTMLQAISDAGGPSSYLLFSRGEKMGSDGRPVGA